MGARKVSAILALAGACCALALPSAASAARSGVTIHLDHGSVFEGFVFSPKPRICAFGRTVNLFKQAGKRQNPKRDERVAQTHAVKYGGKYRWREHDYDPHPGNFYARVPAITGCRADNSKTIHVSARPNTKITQVSIQHREKRAIFRYRTVRGVRPYQHYCRLDKGPVERCTNTFNSYGHVGAGRHVFRVWAVGDNGLKERAPAKRTFHM